MSEIRYIAIEGVIGAGKTTLAKKLSEKLNSNLVLEEFEANPFLEKFYDDRKRYAFQTQMFFLINRYKQQEQLNQEDLFSNFIVSDYIFDKDKIYLFGDTQIDIDSAAANNIIPVLIDPKDRYRDKTKDLAVKYHGTFEYIEIFLEEINLNSAAKEMLYFC